MTEAHYDTRGNYCTGYDAHMKAYRYWTGVKYQQEQDAYRAMSKRA